MKAWNKTIAFGLTLFTLLGVFSGCVFLGGSNDGFNRVRITLPAATASEQVMNATASLAVNSYLTARAYLDLFLEYDVDHLDETGARQFTSILENALNAFETADALSGALESAVDVWEKTPNSEKPKAEKITKNALGLGFSAHAADSAAQKWAQDIVDSYDKAPAGKGIRTLAGQLGTDAKHAYAQLKQALAVLEGAEYTQIADKANTAVQVASGLKAAGTAAGLVIAVAAAPAAGTLGAVVKTGGVVCSGVNTLLEVGSAGSIIYNNGEENEISIACDKTEAQFAPIGQVFSLMGLGYAMKDIGSAGKKIFESGYHTLTPKQVSDLGENAFGVISYGANALNDYVNDGSILSGAFKKTENGLEFALVDTLTGKDPESVEKAKEAIGEAGIDTDKIDTSREATENAKPTGSIPHDIAEEIIDQNEELAENEFDIDEYLKRLEELLYEIAMTEDVPDETGPDEPDDEPDDEEEEETGLSLSRVCGSYHISGTETWEDYDDEEYSGTESISATVTFSPAGTNSITMSVEGYTYGPANYDAEIGTCSFTDEEGLVLFVTFSESEGSIRVALGFDQTFEDGHAYGRFSGTKS